MGLLSRQECEDRLAVIFPREVFDSVASNHLAASAVFAFLYAGAVVPDQHAVDIAGMTLVRPSATLWMSDEAATRIDDASRARWTSAANDPASKRSIKALHTSWGVPFVAWYADNTRETLRDETFSVWQSYGAIRQRTDLPTTSGKPRWGLTKSFASLFDPALAGTALDAAIHAWREDHLDAGARVRIRVARDRASQAASVTLTLPDGRVRELTPGDASAIIVGVVEQWAPRRLTDPVVLSISEPGNKLYLADGAVLASLGMSLNVSQALPDAVLADVGANPVEFWLIEAVATDGPVNEVRKVELTRWAAGNGIAAGRLRFLSAFTSRHAPPAKKRLKDLASGSFAWFLDEPGHELAWYELR